MSSHRVDPLREVQHYLEQYMIFADPAHSFVAALWTAATYCWPEFDAFPYLVINSATKQSGKTRLAELLSFAASNAMRATGISTAPATVFQLIEERQPTLFVDEAESLSRQRSGPLRELMNTGYRRGQVIPRKVGKKFREFRPYCPKVFVLIGDVYDTLRDRSIIVTLRRANREPPKWFQWATATAEGATVGTMLQRAVEEAAGDIRAAKEAGPLRFLMNRDAEVWAPLFAVCMAIAPDRIEELQRAAVDLSAEKTQEARRYSDLESAEDSARDDVYARLLLTHLRDLSAHQPKLFTADLLEHLYAIPTAPWRKYRGEGLTPIMLSDMLSRFGLQPKSIRIGGRKGKVQRGYTREDIARAATSAGLAAQ